MTLEGIYNIEPKVKALLTEAGGEQKDWYTYLKYKKLLLKHVGFGSKNPLLNNEYCWILVIQELVNILDL